MLCPSDHLVTFGGWYVWEAGVGWGGGWGWRFKLQIRH